MKALRGPLVAAAILAVVAGVVYFEYRHDIAREEEEEKARRVFGPDPLAEKAIVGVEIVKGGETISLRREEDGWRLTAPMEARADDGEVEGLLSTLSWLQVTGRLGAAEEPAVLADYGLDPPEMTVSLEEAEGGGTRQISVGHPTPVGSARYAVAEGQEGVITVSSSIRRLLEVEADGLRYSKILGVDSWAVRRVEIEREGERLSLVRTESGWRISEPFDFPAEDTAVSSYIYDLTTLEGEGFAPEEATPAELGLESPTIHLVVETEAGDGGEGEGTRERLEVRLAAAAGEKGGFWALRSDMPDVFRLPRDAGDRLATDADRFRDTRVAPVDRYAISELAVEGPDGSERLVKDGQSNWRRGSAQGDVVEGGRVESLIDALDAVRGVGWIPLGTDGAGGLDREAAGLRIHVRSGGDEPVEVAFRGEHEGWRGVSTTASAFLYKVELPAVERLEEAVATLVSRSQEATAGQGGSGEGDSSS